MRYAKPRSLEEALDLLASGDWQIMAGATDLYPGHVGRPFSRAMLDINGIAALHGIAAEAGHLVLGARTSWSAVARADLPPAFAALQQAAREVGSLQIQNAGTVGGNLCNASPAADGVPPLLVLDAEVELRSAAGLRRLPLSQFVLANRRTALLPGELLTAVRIPRDAAGVSAFHKLGARRYLVISIAMAAARIRLAEDGSIAEAAVAVGACSPAARRLSTLEAALAGLPARELGAVLAECPMPEISPIDDVRGSAAYRREAAREIVSRAVRAAVAADGQARAAA